MNVLTRIRGRAAEWRDAVSSCVIGSAELLGEKAEIHNDRLVQNVLERIPKYGMLGNEAIGLASKPLWLFAALRKQLEEVCGMGEEETKNNRKRNTALVLIGAGLFLLMQHAFGFFPILAVLLILLGIQRIRSRSQRKGYLLVGIGTLILLGNSFSIVLAIIFLSLGFFYLKSKKMHTDKTYMQKQKILDSIRLGREPWILRSSSIWYMIGETHIDLTLAILEQKETTLIIQGIIGDLDIIVPEDIGVSVTSSVMFGQITVAQNRETGIINKLAWQSPNFERSEHRVKLVISYIVGDVDIKIL
jgi:lia operon protein LiaF